MRPMATSIAVVGTGNVGGALGSRLAAAGHDVVYGARDPASDQVRELAARSSGARVAAVPDAADGAEVVILAVPWGAVSALPDQLGDLAGRILVDATNPLAADLTGLTVGGDTSAGEQVAALWPQARVVKAFNTTGAGNLGDPSYPDGPLVMAVCGEDSDAKRTVGGLAKDIGFEPLDAGGIDMARQLEQFALLWIRMAVGQRHGPDFGFRLVRR